MESIDSTLAIFLTGVCNQTYNQFKDPNTLFIVPKGYWIRSTFAAIAYENRKDAFGFILESEHELILAFRGSASHMDTISDLEAFQVDYPWTANGGKTHYGFTEIYQSIRKQIMDALEECPVDKKLILTGHSLGGALATLCALDLVSNSKFIPAIVYTYAAPRVGDPQFAAQYNATLPNMRRIVIISDVVPLIPPPIYKLTSKSKLYYYQHVKEAFTLYFFAASFTKNHSLSSYFNQLAKLNPLYAEELCTLNPIFCPGD